MIKASETDEQTERREFKESQEAFKSLHGFSPDEYVEAHDDDEELTESEYRIYQAIMRDLRQAGLIANNDNARADGRRSVKRIVKTQRFDVRPSKTKAQRARERMIARQQNGGN
jgi:hypothetical protein